MSDRARLTVVAEIATIMGTITGIVGIFITLHAGSVPAVAPIYSNGPSAVDTRTSNASSETTPASPSRPFSTSLASPTPSPQRDDAGSPSSIPEAIVDPKASAQAGNRPAPPSPHDSNQNAQNTAYRGLRIVLSRPERISLQISVGYVFSIPFFGFILGLTGRIFGVRKFSWRVKLIVWGIAVLASLVFGSAVATPAPSNAFQLFILVPVAFLYSCIGSVIYIGVLSKMDV